MAKKFNGVPCGQCRLGYLFCGNAFESSAVIGPQPLLFLSGTAAPGRKKSSDRETFEPSAGYGASPS